MPELLNISQEALSPEFSNSQTGINSHIYRLNTQAICRNTVILDKLNMDGILAKDSTTVPLGLTLRQ